MDETNWESGTWFDWIMPDETYWHDKRTFPCLRSATPNVGIVKFHDADEQEEAVYSITAYPSGAAILAALDASSLGQEGCRMWCGALSGIPIDWGKSPKEIFASVANLERHAQHFFGSMITGKRLDDSEFKRFREKMKDRVNNFPKYLTQQTKRKVRAQQVKEPD